MKMEELTSMNHTRRLRSLRSLPNSPLPHLIRPRRKETPQLQTLPHRRNDLGQRGLRTQLLALLLGLLLVFEAR
jgi:hypothetical protein